MVFCISKPNQVTLLPKPKHTILMPRSQLILKLLKQHATVAHVGQ